MFALSGAQDMPRKVWTEHGRVPPQWSIADFAHLMVSVWPARMFGPEVEAEHVRGEVGTPGLLPRLLSNGSHELLRRGTAREIQGRLLLPLLCGMLVEATLSTEPFVHLSTGDAGEEIGTQVPGVTSDGNSSSAA